MGKTTNLLDPADDTSVNNKFWLVPICDPATGISDKMTIEQAKNAFGTFKIKYVATGSEGSMIVITDLIGKEIVMATREEGSFFETNGSPDTTEFTFDSTTGTITCGLAVTMAGERFQFLYKNPI